MCLYDGRIVYTVSRKTTNMYIRTNRVPDTPFHTVQSKTLLDMIMFWAPYVVTRTLIGPIVHCLYRVCVVVYGKSQRTRNEIVVRQINQAKVTHLPTPCRRSLVRSCREEVAERVVSCRAWPRLCALNSLVRVSSLSVSCKSRAISPCPTWVYSASPSWSQLPASRTPRRLWTSYSLKKTCKH